MLTTPQFVATVLLAAVFVAGSTAMMVAFGVRWIHPPPSHQCVHPTAMPATWFGDCRP